jgi:serine/threonine protein kinase, bacterial
MQQIINNRYLIIQQLGGGGFGDNYLAEDAHLPSRPYRVIKQLCPVINNPDMLKK